MLRKLLNYEKLMIASRIALNLFFWVCFFYYSIPKNIDNYKILYNLYLLSMIIAITWVLTSILKFITRLITNSYGDCGDKENWYKDTMSWMGKDWMIIATEELLNNGLVNSNKLVMASPSANAGVYEKKLFEYLRSKNIDVTMVASDIEVIINHENNETLGNSKYIYVEGKRNALDIKDTLSAAHVNSNLDILWDIKGSLWYSIHKTKSFNENRNNVIKTLEKFNSIIKVNGLLIIDAIPANIPQLIKYAALYIIFARFGIGEESTYQKMEWLLRKEKKICYKNKTLSHDLDTYIHTHFDTYQYKFINSKGKPLTILCLKKK